MRIFSRTNPATRREKTSRPRHVVGRRRLNKASTRLRVKSARGDELPLSCNQNAARFCCPMSVQHQTLPPILMPFCFSLSFSAHSERASQLPVIKGTLEPHTALNHRMKKGKRRTGRRRRGSWQLVASLESLVLIISD